MSDFETFAFDRCLNCPKLGTVCAGPNFFAMSATQWADWCRRRKAYLDMSSAELAQRSGLSLPTVDRVLSGRGKDPQHSTMQLITYALIGGSLDRYPCADPDGETLHRLAAENERLRIQLIDMTQRRDYLLEEDQRKNDVITDRWDFIKSIRDKATQDLNRIQAESERKNAVIRHKNRCIMWLAASLTAAVLGLIAALCTNSILPYL